SWAVVRSEGETVPVKFERDGKVETVQVEPYKAETSGWRRKSVRQLLILPAETAIVDKVEPNSPAAAAGLRPRDIIRGFNHTPIYNPLALLEYIKKHPDESLTLEVERNGSRFELPVKPVPLPTEQTEGKVKMQLRIGIAWDASGQMSIAHPSPIELIYNSVTSTLNTLGAVASPKSVLNLHNRTGRSGTGEIIYWFFLAERGWRWVLGLGVVLTVIPAVLKCLRI